MLSVEDVTRPVGRIDPAWFDDANTVQALVDKANTLSLTDAARVAWVEYRAFSQLSDDAMRKPRQWHADDVGEAFGDAQLTYWQRAAREALDSLNALSGHAASGGFRSVKPVW